MIIIKLVTIVEIPNFIHKSETRMEKICPMGFWKGNLELIVTAKKLGLRVVCLDMPKPAELRQNESRQETALFQNSRDEHMANIASRALGDHDKMLVFIGRRHVAQKPVGKVTRLGARLTSQFGEDKVVSVRSGLRSEQIDNLPISDAPKFEQILEKDKRSFIVPNDGPIKGDVRTTASGYILVGDY